MGGLVRSRWAAIGAATAVMFGGGGIGLSHAALGSGDRPVFVALPEPCRLVDTRPDTQIGPKSTPVAAGDANAYAIQVTGGSGDCTGPLAVPGTAAAVALNVTAIAPAAPETGRSFFTVFPADTARPGTSNLNFLDGGAPTPNKVDVGLSSDGKIVIYNHEGTAHAAVDVFGYYVDHHHDDRYFTETEVLTALSFIPPVLFATVAPADATAEIVREHGALSVERISIGFYVVTFYRDVRDCAWNATYGQPTDAGVDARWGTVRGYDQPTQVGVVLRDANGVQADGVGFHLSVICPA